jgi:signal transduction histidine kinase
MRERQIMIHRSATRLLKLVNSLLDFSRIEAGRVQANYEPTDLSALTTDFVRYARDPVQGLAFFERQSRKPGLS